MEAAGGVLLRPLAAAPPCRKRWSVSSSWSEPSLAEARLLRGWCKLSLDSELSMARWTTGLSCGLRYGVDAAADLEGLLRPDVLAAGWRCRICNATCMYDAHE